MPILRDPGSRPARQGPGWEQRAWVTPQLLGVPVPMQAWRWRAGPEAASPVIGLGAPEGMLYLAAGSVTAEVSGQRFALAPESILWLVNDTDANFSFVEFWTPPPAGTVWTTPGDRSTWAPAS